MNKTNKWKMCRAGLLNFWYYDYEVFDFSDGKLLLRGSNGSGKSVTMQSFLPVLLDGRKSPDRLDPFGSKARRMEDYLLGEKEVVDRDERTGYLFIEYELEGTGQYVTTGIGLQAKRQKQMKFWGFVISDNRRIGKDFKLYKEEKGERIPFSRVELENRIGDGGEVVQTTKEYMALVNKYVFGFETTEAYEDLIKLLIQLRSPKLSKDFRPTVIYDILEAALPPLTDEDLRHLSDTIEHMDQTRQQIEQMTRELQALQKLNTAYRIYNEFRIADQAKEFLAAERRTGNAEKNFQATAHKKSETEKEMQQLEVEKQQLLQREEILSKQMERLHSHDVWKLEKEKKETEAALHHSQQELVDKEAKLSKRQQSERRIGDEIDDKELFIEEKRTQLDDQLVDLENDADESSFLDHELNVRDFRRSAQNRFSFDTWEKQANQHTNKLKLLEERLEELEKQKQRLEEKEKEFGDLEYSRDLLRHEEKDWERIFEEDKQKKVEEIYAWAKGNQQWEVSEDLLQETTRKVYQLYEPVLYKDLVDPYENIYSQFTQRIYKQRIEREHQIEHLQEEIDDKQSELTAWKKKKDPEPLRSPQTEISRQELSNTAFVPFYEAVEFKDGIGANAKKRIEAALSDIGLLDALITEDPIHVKHDRIIKPNPHTMAHTLAAYLVPDISNSRVSHKQIEQVLQSIHVGEEEESFISDDGTYRLNLLEGHAVEIDEVRYIGRHARERFREQMIAELEVSIEELKNDQSSIYQHIYDLEKEMEVSYQMMHAFPDDEDLQHIFQSLEVKRREIEQMNLQLQKKDEERKELYRTFRSMNQQLEELIRPYNLKRSRQSYKEAAEVMAQYEKDLRNVKLIHQEMVHTFDHLTRLNERLEEIREETDELKGEVHKTNDQIERRQLNVNAIEEQLEKEGAEELRHEINRVQNEQAEVNQDLEEVKEQIPVHRVNLAHLKDRQIEQERTIHGHKRLQSEWERSFLQEWNFGFVFHEAAEDINVVKLAKELQRTYGFRLNEREASQAMEQLTKSFYDLHGDLMEYQMQQYESTLPAGTEMSALNENEQVYWRTWQQKARRSFVELNYFGKQVSPMYVEETLRTEEKRQRQMLDEQDRELYEEILFKSVGNKLRSRIQRAEKWTRKMNRLMESRNSSSGLTFSIRWKPKTADQEEEIDTKELVELLNRPAQVLKDEDFNRMIGHFRSRIDRAKTIMYEKGEGQTLLQVLKEVLDYRKWFSFVLAYKRPSEQKRELTNNAFYKFSGGEKAMAMYIPLFAACYSRYQEAADTAPYIISLDEAFAGVDENNIREMFEIVEELGFDYIMNSQVLWGDYDTVQKLAVSELIRPQNAGFVTVMNYLWDGKYLKDRPLDKVPINE